MVKKTPKRSIIKNNQAISEEFTSLPALSVIMIGFAIFILLIANTYSAYNQRTENLEKYQNANQIATKITNPDCFFIKEGRIIDLPALDDDIKKSDSEFEKIRSDYQSKGINFVIKINYGPITKNYPTNADDILDSVAIRTAVTKHLAVFLNEAHTKAGSLTIITWEA